MSEDRTKDLPTKHSFEERVMARLDAIDSRLTGIENRIGAVETRLDGVESRLGTLESKQKDTRPIWEDTLKIATDTRREMRENFAIVNDRLDSLDRRMTILAGDVLETRGQMLLSKMPAKKRLMSEKSSTKK